MFFNLIPDEGKRFFYHVEYAPSKYIILYHIHLSADFGFRAIVTDKADFCPLEVLLRVFPEQKDMAPLISWRP